jgi:predicted DNA-binding transcriptional regulator AlpA
MNNANAGKVVRHELQQIKEESGPDGRKDEVSQPRLLVCLLLVPSDAEPILAMLERLAASSQTPISFPSLLNQEPHGTGEDRWLKHTEAAKCLGISMSTLYRYVSHQRIECRKIGGRLEYRQSLLEKLKREQTRPARLSYHAGGIIPSALSSGE